MRIQNNISAINALRQTSINRAAVSKSTEKLSTGYRVNRAADDAAGLAISEKMRSQIRGINQAVENAQDGISLVQTAEGAMQEVTGMLQRMKTLATKSANGIYDNGVDRKAIQMEVDQLSQEMNRIVSETNFNGRYLFSQGQLANDAEIIPTEPPNNFQLQIGPKGSEVLTINAKTMLNLGQGAEDMVSAIQGNGNPGVDEEVGALANIMAGGTGQSITTMAENTEVDFDSTSLYLRTINVGGAPDGEQGFNNFWDNQDYDNMNNEENLAYAVGQANTAVTNINDAINAVSVSRSYLGAIQNRLESTVNNQQVVAENMTAAESRIRDLDIAAEMVTFTKNNILVQSSQAMLAQANSQPQSVLQLLQG